MATIQSLGFIHNRKTNIGAGNNLDPVQEPISLPDLEGAIPDYTIPWEKTTLGVVQIKQYLRGGSTGYDQGVGYWLGHDGQAYKFFIGNSAGDKMTWDGNTLTITGSLVAGQIHIPDKDTTANSFHVDTTGNMWIGCTNTDFFADNENADVYFLNTGDGFIRQNLQVGASSGTHIDIDGVNGVIQSSNYAVGAAGFKISPEVIEAENLRARGSLQGATFQYDIISAIAGQLMVSNSDVIDVDMTALDASTLTTRGNTTFAVNDMLHIKAITAVGIEQEYLRITDISGAPTYVVTRDLSNAYAADSNPIWTAGTTIVKEGSSDGALAYSGGWLRLIGEGTPSPYYSVFARTGVLYNDYVEVVRLGNLNGVAGIASDTFGLFMGDYSGDRYFLYDSSSGAITVRRGKVNDLFDGDLTIAYNYRGRIETITDDEDGVVYTPTYVKGRMATIGNGTFTWTFTYSGNRITSITKA